jgi:hypothetical protein
MELCRFCYHRHRHYIYIGITWHNGIKFRIKRCGLCGGEWEEEA